jgi:murein tripeptide amidase MpaA
MLNMIKGKSLYNEGMKVLMYSEKRQEWVKEQKESGIISSKDKELQEGWTRGGDDLSYYQNNYKKDQSQQTNFFRCYQTFTFTHTFEYDDDQVYFSYSQPYTYSDLNDDLSEIQSRQLNFVTRNTLCRTIAGNRCEYLTITNRCTYEVDQKKEGVVITARIHPGESNSSFMMKGVIEFLISNDPKAVELRDKFVFKIVPMMNPDGVINGNYRCSLAGCDLNRRWKYPSEMLHPTVYHTKNLISKLSKERPLALYCDLHGHSRRKNVFMYGNEMAES